MVHLSVPERQQQQLKQEKCTNNDKSEIIAWKQQKLYYFDLTSTIFTGSRRYATCEYHKMDATY